MRRPIARRRMLTACLGLLVAGAAKADRSRQWRVAYVGSGRTTIAVPILREALRQLGYEEGKNLILDVRAANGHYAILPDLLKEVVGLRPDVIVAEATPAVAAAQKATSTIPIVMSPASDPVGSGFVESFARPGGNITGVANMFGDTTTKTLDIIRLVLPNVKMIGVLISNNPTHPRLLEVAKQAAASMAIFAEGFVAPNPDDLERAFAEMKSANCDAVYVLADPVRPAIPGIALKSGLPTIYQVNTYVTEGGLMSYGPDVPGFFSLAARYVDRILKGGKPAEIPVEQPTKFLFVVNLRTAKGLGLTIPESVLLMADKVIE
ncbi:ABC transporter substrate-binding protein [Bradyrhizobium sp. AUGA SZCCT0240]|uniref:ABC transporter substrate-binding protein n=1 Tax=unclassified Bradyrhizobium TaxID=2631580 RepID=UPI001BA4D322|nr:MULTISPECIES: ABC transporter substrate-binding protein [unclassified Bradyrhizobium]MBR1200314.1 ABC transporter substrate-binding protein [Bradyrhizobium sp. AUGA SZCCT0158]MBR1241054.1 ABC transporter substrate-binding protein [Bradyrhizobium sp. AUGA SZCCT0274]MBR1255888.1 ABC transporter substrate-binding protein [Bradyrhizobium sp. AUGA SZCCT0240]